MADNKAAFDVKAEAAKLIAALETFLAQMPDHADKCRVVAAIHQLSALVR